MAPVRVCALDHSQSHGIAASRRFSGFHAIYSIAGYRKLFAAWTDQQVDMLGHDHVCPDREVMPVSGEVGCVAETPSREAAGEELAPVEAGEGQEIGMSNIVEYATCHRSKRDRSDHVKQSFCGLRE